MFNFLKNLREQRENEEATRQTIEEYRTGSPEVRQEIEDLLWNVGKNKGDMAGAENIVKLLRKTL